MLCRSRLSVSEVSVWLQGVGSPHVLPPTDEELAGGFLLVWLFAVDAQQESPQERTALYLVDATAGLAELMPHLPADALPMFFQLPQSLFMQEAWDTLSE